MAITSKGQATSSQGGLPDRPEKTGFASQTAEFQTLPLDLHDLVAPSRMTTFFFEAEGPPPDEHVAVTIAHGDIIVVDRLLPMVDGMLVLADDGEQFVVRRLQVVGQQLHLVADDAATGVLIIDDERCLVGAVTWIIHRVPQPRKGQTP